MLQEILPDFDDLQGMISQIFDLQSKKAYLDVEIKATEALVTREVTTNEKYFTNGKAPSMEFIKSTYQYSGIDGKLIEKRKEYADVAALLEFKRLSYDLAKMKVDVWRTRSANERLSVE